MRLFRNALIGLGRTAVWPSYLALAAYAARQAPLPRSVGPLIATILLLLTGAFFAANAVRRLLRDGGFLETQLEMPARVVKQLRWAALMVILGHVVLLLPCWLLSSGLITSAGRPVTAPTLARLLIITFELLVLGVAFRLVRTKSALMEWVEVDPKRFWGLARARRFAALGVLAAIAGIMALDVRGYSFSGLRPVLERKRGQSILVVAACVTVNHLLRRAIHGHAWHWLKPGAHDLEREGAPPDLIHRLRRLAGYAAALLGLFLGCRVWDIDLALFKFILEQSLWSIDGGVPVTVADVARSAIIGGLAMFAWRHMSTFFAVAVFPRMPDDPGVRFAVVTLCRYAVLAAGVLGEGSQASIWALRRLAICSLRSASGSASAFRRSSRTSSAALSCSWSGRSGSATS